MRSGLGALRRAAPLAAVLLCLTLRGPVAAQGVTVLGTLTDGASDVPVENAIVTLEGLGSTMSTPEGTFRFRGIAPGGYALRVDAFGYADLEVRLELSSDTTLALTLEAAPVEIDGVLVEAGTLDFEGRVRDPVRDFTVVDAEVVMEGRDPIWTDAHGRFDLDGVAEDVPVHLTIRAFGYLPIDTTFVPDDDGRHDFLLESDAFAQAMIDVQVERLANRAAGRSVSGFGTMDRSEILRFAGAHTARSMLDFELPGRIWDRVLCVFIDEEQIDVDPVVGAELRDFILDQTLPEEIERVELLVFDGVDGRPIMVQIFTRSFIMAMATEGIELRQPTVTIFGQCF